MTPYDKSRSEDSSEDDFQPDEPSRDIEVAIQDQLPVVDKDG